VWNVERRERETGRNALARRWLESGWRRRRAGNERLELRALRDAWRYHFFEHSLSYFRSMRRLESMDRWGPNERQKSVILCHARSLVRVVFWSISHELAATLSIAFRRPITVRCNSFDAPNLGPRYITQALESVNRLDQTHSTRVSR
jgi:hypothetical protein